MEIFQLLLSLPTVFLTLTSVCVAGYSCSLSLSYCVLLSIHASVHPSYYDGWTSRWCPVQNFHKHCCSEHLGASFLSTWTGFLRLCCLHSSAFSGCCVCTQFVWVAGAPQPHPQSVVSEFILNIFQHLSVQVSDHTKILVIQSVMPQEHLPVSGSTHITPLSIALSHFLGQGRLACRNSLLSGDTEGHLCYLGGYSSVAAPGVWRSCEGAGT